jgi:hypothetical protein
MIPSLFASLYVLSRAVQLNGRDARSELRELVLVEASADNHLEGRVIRRDQGTGQLAFPPLVLHAPDVLEPRVRTSDRYRERALDEEIVRGLRVVRDLEVEPIVPQPGIEPVLLLGRALWLERRVTDTCLGERHCGQLRVVDAHRHRVHVGDGIAEVRLPTRLPIRGTQAERREHVILRPEPFLARDPRRVDRRIVDPPEPLAEGAVAVAAHAEVDEQSVAPRHLLLAEDA